RSSCSGSVPPTTVSQSPPVTVKTLPSAVSRSVAYVTGLTFRSQLRCSQARSSCSPLSAFRSQLRCSQARSSSRSLVRPPAIRRRDLRALVLDGNAAKRIVLALRETLPVVRHENPGERGVPIEDDAEHVVRLPLLPVGRRVDAGDARDVRVLRRNRNLKANP